jgi:hypothetical protein
MPKGFSQPGYELLEDLELLSGTYTDPQDYFIGQMVSNDRGYTEILDSLKAKRLGKEPGLGIFIGSGGLLSMLPDVNLSVALCIDKSKAVLEYNRVLRDYVTKSATPAAALIKMVTPMVLMDSPDLNQDIAILGGSTLLPDILGSIKIEAKEYDGNHWTNYDRFPVVQSALASTAIGSALADITKPGFAEAISEICQRHDTPISYANLTNIHNYLDPNNRDFLKHWPLDDDPTIVASHFGETVDSGYPTMFISHSADEYESVASADPVDLREAEEQKRQMLREARQILTTPNL